MAVLFFLFCLVTVSSLGILCCTDVCYYHVSNFIIYITLVFLGAIIGCCGFFGSFAYVLYAPVAAGLLGGTFLLLRFVAQVLERVARGRKIFRLNNVVLNRRVFALGLGDVKVAALIGLITGFTIAGKESLNGSIVTYGIPAIGKIIGSLYLIIVLTFADALLWVAVRKIRRRIQRPVQRGLLADNRQRRAEELTYYLLAAPEERMRHEKIPLVPCMVLAMSATVFCIVMA